MKKLFSMVALLAALVISVSCNKDSDLSNGDLVGTWELLEEYEKVEYDGEVEEDSYSYESGECLWVFKSNGTLVIVEEDMANPEMPAKSNNDVSDVIYYKVNGSEIILTYEGESESFDIKKLDSKEMILSSSYEEGSYSLYTEATFKRKK